MGGELGGWGARGMGEEARKQVRAWRDKLRDGGSCPTNGGRRGEERRGEVMWEKARRFTVRTRHRSSSLNRVLGTSRAGSGDAGGAGDGTVPDVPEQWEQAARSTQKLPAQARGRGTGGVGVGKGVERGDYDKVGIGRQGQAGASAGDRRSGEAQGIEREDDDRVRRGRWVQAGASAGETLEGGS